MDYSEGLEPAGLAEWIEFEIGIKVRSIGRGVDMKFIVLDTNPDANLPELWAKVKICPLVAFQSYEALWVFESYSHVHKMVIYF